MHRLITRLAHLHATDGGKYVTVWCSACGWYMPLGHGCQNGR